MLTIRLICVGKLGEKFWKQASDEYEKRLGAYCKLEIVELPEQRLPDSPSSGQIEAALRKEKELIEAKIPAGAGVIAMCIEGKTLDSEAFAEWIERKLVSGTSKLAVLIGGSCGMDETLKQKADLRLSM